MRIKQKLLPNTFPVIEEKGSRVNRIPGIPTLRESEAEYEDQTNTSGSNSSSLHKRDSIRSEKKTQELIEASETLATRDQ